MGNTNPKILNLDDLELQESEITIRHDGVDHKMRTLTVEMFIAQQKRAVQHEKMIEAKAQAEETDMGDVVALIRDAILEFFPTLPANDLPTGKLFAVFAWMNELTDKLNEANAPEPEAASAEGNAEATTETAES